MGAYDGIGKAMGVVFVLGIIGFICLIGGGIWLAMWLIENLTISWG